MQQLERVEGDENGVHVAIEGLPVVECLNGHRRFPSPEFPLDFIQKLADSQALADIRPAVQKGIFRKRRHCPSCGSELSLEANGSIGGRTTVQVPDCKPVAVEISVPQYLCPSCKQESSESQAGLQRNLMQAVANAFRSADIPPG
jgi:hypothetical protein